jgi:tRNA threonylcarbamoyladenosine biosynthesis protein TsaB
MMGLRATTGLPLAAVPTLEAMAWNVPRADVPLCPVLKARTGEVYWGLYQWTGAGTLQRLADERVGPLAAVVRSFVGPTVVLGEGWIAYHNELRRLLGPREGEVREAPAAAMAASAVSVGLAGLERLARGDIAVQGLSPRYVQRAEAELKAVRDRLASASTLESSN